MVLASWVADLPGRLRIRRDGGYDQFAAASRLRSATTIRSAWIGWTQLGWTTSIHSVPPCSAS
jgi:hypothetical protein